MQKSRQNRHLDTIAKLCRAICSQLRHVSAIGKKLLSSNMCSICPHNMVNFGPLAAEIVYQFGAPQLISTGFASWQRYCTALQYWASAKFCDVEQMAPPIFGRAAITLGIGPHSSCYDVVWGRYATISARFYASRIRACAESCESWT